VPLPGEHALQRRTDRAEPATQLPAPSFLIPSSFPFPYFNTQRVIPSERANARDARDLLDDAVTDKLGSVRGLVKKDGTWQWGTQYTPYGLVFEHDTVAGATPRLPIGWTGARYDLETGFYFLRNRYYDPAAGRFTQEDLIGYGGGGNVYAYGSGSPLTGRDPAGTRMDGEMYEPCHHCRDLDALSSDDGSGWGGQDWIDGFVTLAWIADQTGATTNQVQNCLTASDCDVPNDDSRTSGLSDSQRSALGNFCQVIKCDPVRITTKSGNLALKIAELFTGGETIGITLGDHIYFRDAGDPSIGDLAHEMTHVWQFQVTDALQVPSAYFIAGGLTQTVNLFHDVYNPHDYNHSCRSYGMEQQATIVENCFNGVAAACGTPGEPFHP